MANIAIYWDFENIHASLATLQFGKDWYRANRFDKQPKLLDIGLIMEYAASLGNININRAYANWTYFVGYGADLQTHTVDLIQLYPRGAHGKNGSDIRMATDVIDDIARHPQIDTVVVVGGDSDYIAVAQRVRERGHRIVGIGVQETTNRYWVASCNEFKFYASLQAKAVQSGLAASSPEAAPEIGPARREADEDENGLAEGRALLRRAMTQLMAQSGGAPVKQTLVKTMMLRLDPSFDEGTFGFRTFSDFLDRAGDLVSVARTQNDRVVSLNGAAVAKPAPATPVPDGNPYAAILRQQSIRLPDLRLWNAAMEETFALLGGGRFTRTVADFKAALAVRLKARGETVTSGEVTRFQNVLFRSFAFKIDSQEQSMRLVPDVRSAADLSMLARQAITKRILDNLDEAPDPARLAEVVFGSAGQSGEARALIDWYNRP